MNEKYKADLTETHDAIKKAAKVRGLPSIEELKRRGNTMFGVWFFYVRHLYTVAEIHKITSDLLMGCYDHPPRGKAASARILSELLCDLNENGELCI